MAKFAPIGWFGFDLRLMSSVNDVNVIPTEGKNLIIVAAVNNVLHFRIFDGDGKEVVDTDENRLKEEKPQIGQQIEELRKRLENLWPLHQLTSDDKVRVITAVTSIVGHTRWFVSLLTRFKLWVLNAGTRVISRFRQNPGRAAGRIRVVVRGVVLEEGTGRPIFAARVRHPSSRQSIRTDAVGSFSLLLPNQPLGNTSRLVILSPGYWPTTHRITPNGPMLDLGNQCSLNPVAGPFKSGTFALILGCYPQILSYWKGRTPQEQIMSVLLLVLLAPLAALYAIDQGLPIPGTDVDEMAREMIQRVPWLPSRHPLVQFSKPRARYFSGVHYVIAPGDYSVDSGGILIEQGSEVTIEQGATFRMAKNAHLLVEGKLIAEGSADKEIRFVPLDNHGSWGNVTFWGEGTIGSVLTHWFVSGGTGRGVSGSDTGFLVRTDKGQKVGGGMLLFNTSVKINNSQIEDCSATHGGGLYIRNSPRFKTENLPGSRLTEVTFLKCVAQGAKNSGGGAVMVKNCYPEFRECHFEENSSEGKSACGGGVYMGIDSRGLFETCTFLKNRSEAEGGGLYAYLTSNIGDEHRSGVVIRERSLFEGNRGHGGGGACCGHDSRFALINTTFRNNHAETYLYPDHTQQAAGGGIFLRYDGAYKSTVPCLLDDCTFESNWADAPQTIPANSSEESFVGGALVLSTETRIKLLIKTLTCKGNTARRGMHLALPDNSLYEGWAGPGHWTQIQFSDPGPSDRESIYIYTLKLPHASPIEITENHRLTEDCYGERPKATQVSAVVLHYTSAVEIKPSDPYNLDLILQIFAGKAPGVTDKTSAHFLVERGGRVHRLVDESKRAWHAGYSALPSGEEDLNDFSIGIEVIQKPDESPTNEQYEALASLLLLIKKNHPKVTLNRIVGHDLVRSEWNRRHPDRAVAQKEDPGFLFHWSRLLSRLSELRFEAQSP